VFGVSRILKMETAGYTNVGAYVVCYTALCHRDVHCHENIVWYPVQFRNSVGWLR
jgi:hypothetical protein